MRYLALVTDYDGTLASDDRVSAEALQVLHRLRASDRRAILVTGRRLDDLLGVCNCAQSFDMIVAENGAIVYDPATREEARLANPPSKLLLQGLRSRVVAPLEVGQVVVSTHAPHRRAVQDLIWKLRLEAQIIGNRGVVMVLPARRQQARGPRARAAQAGTLAPRSRRHRRRRERSLVSRGMRGGRRRGERAAGGQGSCGVRDKAGERPRRHRAHRRAHRRRLEPHSRGSLAALDRARHEARRPGRGSPAVRPQRARRRPVRQRQVDADRGHRRAAHREGLPGLPRRSRGRLRDAARRRRARQAVVCAERRRRFVDSRRPQGESERQPARAGARRPARLLRAIDPESAGHARTHGQAGKTLDWSKCPPHEPGNVVASFTESGEQPFALRPFPGSAERVRHKRKYAEGDLRWYSFKVPRLRLPAQPEGPESLSVFCRIAEGIDEETWMYHLRRGDYSRWFRYAVRDDVLADRGRAHRAPRGRRAVEDAQDDHGAHSHALHVAGLTVARRLLSSV